MNSEYTAVKHDTASIKQWILSHLQKECEFATVSPEVPLVEQLDSFQMVGFLVACDDEFPGLKISINDSFNGLTIDEIAIFIATRINTPTSDNS